MRKKKIESVSVGLKLGLLLGVAGCVVTISWLFGEAPVPVFVPEVVGVTGSAVVWVSLLILAALGFDLVYARASGRMNGLRGIHAPTIPGLEAASFSISRPWPHDPVPALLMSSSTGSNDRRQKRSFPWLQCSLWLRDGVTAAHILNKFVIASWPPNEARRAAKPVVEDDEVKFLHVVLEDGISARNATIVSSIAKKLQPGGYYFTPEEDEAQGLRAAFSEYGAGGASFVKFKGHLGASGFLRPDDQDQEKSILHLLVNIWNTLPPAMIPDPDHFLES